MLYFGPWKLITIILVVLAGIVFTAPNLVPEEERFTINEIDGSLEAKGIWRFLPNRSINLGLDLQGGSHIVFAVDMDEVREAQLEGLAADARQTLRNEQILTRSVSVVGDEVVVLLIRPEERQRALDQLQTLNGPVTTEFGGPSLAQMYSMGQDDDDPSAIRISVTAEQFAAIKNRTLSQAITVIRRRIDGLGTTDPTIARAGEDRVLVQVPGAEDPQEIIDLVGTQAALSFHMVDSTIDPGPNGQARTPPGRTILPLANSQPIQYLAIETRQLLTGENLTNANVTTHPSYTGPVVGFRFDTQGALVFGDVTSNNRGRQFAIVLDGEIISAPRINEPILGGSGVIGGGYTYETASQLVILLNAGALPATLTPVEERTVSPSLGHDQIESGKLAIIIGFALVIVFMIAAYGVFGVFSVLALLVNVVLILGGLSGLGMTLTLPGIAGIILTIGMAVDANVLIFERIREEGLKGRTPANAIQAGYEQAFAAIVDANVTTFIAAAVLYLLGAGPVRGFAVTLGVGIITSVFTAFVFSRLLAVLWLRGFKPKQLPI